MCASGDVLPVKFADSLDGLLTLAQYRGKPLPDVNHVVPDFESHVDAGGFGAVCEVERIIEQRFRRTDMDEQRRQSMKVRVKR